MTEWKKIYGYENYEVSEDGNVRNSQTGYNLRHTVDKQGYHLVGLSKNGKRKTQVVHRLVAQAFIDNPEKKEIVKHRDGNNENNDVFNLYWMSFAEVREINGHTIREGSVGTVRKMTLEEYQTAFGRHHLTLPN